jgi:secreted PhoX family phosphatase
MEIFHDILNRRTSRRTVLQWGGMAALAAGVSALPRMAQAGQTALTSSVPALDFESVKHAYTQGHELAQGYQMNLVMRWGDPLDATQGAFDPAALTAKTQEKRFGFNNDFLAYLPFTKNSKDSTHGLLHANHEYTDIHLMFPKTTTENATPEQLKIEMAAHGFSVVEIKRDAAQGWQQVVGSKFARRVTATTPIAISGSAAGHTRMRTLKDPTGKLVLGTMGNCAGGVTPWGTVLTCEENIDVYFYGKTVGDEAKNHERYTIGKETGYGWYKIDSRFAVAREPNEPNRFGWVVEYDPHNPKSQPVKRTALGRFKHETATCAIAHDGRAVVYSGDDDYFEYLYRFVSEKSTGLHLKPLTEQGEAHSVGESEDRGSIPRDLLDSGTLQVAKFHDNGKLEWIPLVHGQNGLTAKNGFHSQADVLIEARRAGDTVGATHMDRPEGIAIHPHTQAVYVSLTKNPKRTETDAANPRPANKAGHIVMLQPANGDHGSNDYTWEIFVLAGDPDADAPRYGKRPKQNDWFSNPDNLAMDPRGRLWVCTDGMPEANHLANGLYAMPTTGESRAAPKCFFRAPQGAEVTGLCFTPDGETLFLSVQHPAEDEGSTFDTPSTRWPDFREDLPPRPSVVAFTRKKGGVIGG